MHIVTKMSRFCLRFQDSPTASPTGFYFPYGGWACLHRLIKFAIKNENMDENLQRNNVARQHPKDYQTEKMMGAANLFAIKIISARHF